MQLMKNAIDEKGMPFNKIANEQSVSYEIIHLGLLQRNIEY